MVTRTLIQVKQFDIIAQGEMIIGHGYSDEIPAITWVKGQIWESDQQCNELLELAINEWEEMRKKNPWGTTDNKPKLYIYWQ